MLSDMSYYVVLKAIWEFNPSNIDDDYWDEGGDASEGTRLIYPKTVKLLVKIKEQAKYVRKQHHFTQYQVEFPLPGLKIKIITQTNLLKRTSTHNLSPKAEAEAKAKDKFKAFCFKLVSFVSS